MIRVPLGLTFQASRCVSAGIGAIGCGYIDIGFLLVLYFIPLLLAFYYFFHSPAESDGRTGDNGGGKEDSHDSACGNPCPGAMLSRLLVLVDVHLAFSVFRHKSGIVRADHATTVQFLHRGVVLLCIVHAAIGTDEDEHILI